MKQNPLPSIPRRRLLQGLVPGLTLLPTLGFASEGSKPTAPASLREGFSLDDQEVRLYSSALQASAKVLFLSDTHLFHDDERGEPFKPYSARMAKAYNQTKHYKTGEPTNPEACFEATLELAKEQQTDLLILGGDIMSFPSEAAIEWVLERLYTAGNHDWHYEGMEGSSAELRQTWIQKRLQPLYQSHDPMMRVQEVNGLQVVTIDNSIYEISPAQLAFLQKQVDSQRPFILALHIPLYAPGRSVGFGCGHPEWGAATDKNYQIERRPRWREKHSEVTMEFHRLVFYAANLLAVFAGHIHRQSVEVLNGIPQVVAGANANGSHLRIHCFASPSNSA
jgi:predicted phosphodiesterase